VKGKSFLGFLLILAVLLGGVFVWLMVNLVFPVNPANSYFPSNDDRLGGIHWNLGKFQPVYLFSFASMDNYFIKVAYRDGQQKIKLMDVLVGRKGTDSIPFSKVVLKDGGGTADIGGIGEYGKYFKAGDRIYITYLRNVLKRPGDQLDIIEPNAENTKGVCGLSKMLCFSLKLALANATKLWDFPIIKNFPNDILFPGISLSKILIN